MAANLTASSVHREVWIVKQNGALLANDRLLDQGLAKDLALVCPLEALLSDLTDLPSGEVAHCMVVMSFLSSKGDSCRPTY